MRTENIVGRFYHSEPSGKPKLTTLTKSTINSKCNKNGLPRWLSVKNMSSIDNIIGLSVYNSTFLKVNALNNKNVKRDDLRNSFETYITI